MNIFEKEIQEQQKREDFEREKLKKFDDAVIRLVGLEIPRQFVSFSSVTGYEITNYNRLWHSDDHWEVYRKTSGEKRDVRTNEHERNAFLFLLRETVEKSTNEKSPK